jgi:anti-sigma B factor antagonist
MESDTVTPMGAGTPFEISVSEEPDTVVIAVSGELDLATAPQLREACAKAVQSAAGTVRIDVGGLTFLDSSGISVLVETHRDLEARNGSLILHCVGDRTQRVLEVAGLSDFFAHSDQPAG